MVTGEADREGCSPEMTVLEMAEGLNLESSVDRLT